MRFQGRVVVALGVFVVATCWTVPRGSGAVLLGVFGLMLVVVGLLIAKSPAA